MRIPKISVFIISSLSITGYVYAEQPMPTIYIKHTVDNATVRNMLKIRWNQCKQLKKTYLNTRDKQPDNWLKLEARIKKRTPDFNINAALAPTPNWDNIALEEEREYFNGDYYASYVSKLDYTLSTDGRCSVVSSEKKSAELDDGKFRYLIDLSKGSGVKYPSEVINYNKSIKLITPDSAKLAMNVLNKKGEPDMLNAPTAGGSDLIANQKCDYKEFSQDGNSKSCYWTKMNHYPTIASRPIILKTVIKIGNNRNIKKADSFVVGKPIAKNIFKPDPKLKIDDRSH